jgi:hypothetical protein
MVLLCYLARIATLTSRFHNFKHVIEPQGRKWISVCRWSVCFRSSRGYRQHQDPDQLVPIYYLLHPVCGTFHTTVFLCILVPFITQRLLPLWRFQPCLWPNRSLLPNVLPLFILYFSWLWTKHCSARDLEVPNLRIRDLRCQNWAHGQNWQFGD